MVIFIIGARFEVIATKNANVKTLGEVCLIAFNFVCSSDEFFNCVILEPRKGIFFYLT